MSLAVLFEVIMAEIHARFSLSYHIRHTGVRDDLCPTKVARLFVYPRHVQRSKDTWPPNRIVAMRQNCSCLLVLVAGPKSHTCKPFPILRRHFRGGAVGWQATLTRTLARSRLDDPWQLRSYDETSIRTWASCNASHSAGANPPRIQSSLRFSGRRSAADP